MRSSNTLVGIIGLILIVFANLSFIPKTYCQSTSHNQIRTDLQLTRSLGKNWVGEFNLISIYTNIPQAQNNPFARRDERGARLWIHHNVNKRWKLSAFAAYYDKYQVDELPQAASHEWRFAPQGIYYLYRQNDIKLTTRARFEMRLIDGGDKKYELSPRYRQQIKFLMPFNRPTGNENQWYWFVMDEVFFNVFEHPEETFDRNRASAALGCAFSKDFQVELAYRNNYVPRPQNNEIYNQLYISLVINNLYAKLTNRTPRSELDVKSD